MGYCAPRGIPLSTFLGWSQADQDAALSWVAYESRRCRSCGHHPDEGRPHTHVNVCSGCRAMSAAADTEPAKVPGAHVRIAHGPKGECPHCRRMADLNRG